MTELATFGGGCFWCLEAVFIRVRGVDSVHSGYAGGDIANPSYEQVCSGSTGHAEVIQLRFDPQQVSFRDLLEVFFHIHDPTTLNRQGGDVGTQYRSVIFYHSTEQKQMAEEVIKQIAADEIWEGKIVTEIVPLEQFFPAETYHQDYYRRNSDKPYCVGVISPKLRKLMKEFPSLTNS